MKPEKGIFAAVLAMMLTAPILAASSQIIQEGIDPMQIVREDLKTSEEKAPPVSALKERASCPFCSPVPKNELIAENNKFFVKATYGMMGVEGYILLIPKAHIPSYGDLSKEDNERFTEALDRTVTAISKAYSAPIVFEHGITGQTVGHAHTHIIPGINFDRMVAETEKLICKGKNPCDVVKKIVDPKNAWREKSLAKSKAGGYLYISDPAKGQAVLFYLKPDPNLKMVLRKAAAGVLGDVDKADWKKVRESPKLLKEDEALREKTTRKLRTENLLPPSVKKAD